ncbi:hypothetical protein N431DRAFT_552319 [Stipitochalara longipes BDJ]|nr:hypothetical protein N431DRAFT_552319 [Stipitochalara longipes BDJ]
MPAYRNKTGPNRGKRTQGKGWRHPCSGNLYFQLKRDSFSRCHELPPRQTMDNLIDSLERDVKSDYPALDEGLEFAFYLRKHPLERSNERAFNILDGGETVYVKIVDDEGTEYVKSYALGGGR